MSRIQRKYWLFYVMGREESRLPKSEVDIDEDSLADSILADESASFFESIVEACRAAAKDTVITERRRKNWIKAHAEDLKEFGEAHRNESWSEGEAYETWLEGRLEQFAFAIEQNILGSMSVKLFESED